MSRYRVLINDSKGVHTPSYPFGTRRAAEVFAANRSRFRRDCFVIVCREGEKFWLVAYRNGHLQDSQVTGAFKPEPVVIRDGNGTVYYGLLDTSGRAP